MKRIKLTRDRSGRSGRRRGSQKLGTGGLAIAARVAADGRAGVGGSTGAGCSFDGRFWAAAGTSVAKQKPASSPIHSKRNAAMRRAGVESEIAAKVIGGSFRSSAQAERRNKMSILIHQIDDGSVVHRVVIALGRDLLVIDSVGFCDGCDRVRTTGYAAQVRIEA